MKWRITCVLLLASMSMACDLSTQGDTGGTFNANVSGAISADMEGTAIFYTAVNGEFAMALTDPADGEVIALASAEGRPGVGISPIEHFEVETGFIARYARDDAPAGDFRSESGQVEITSSGATRVRGELTFEAVGSLDEDPDTEVRVTVVASFDARCVPTGGSPCL